MNTNIGLKSNYYSRKKIVTNYNYKRFRRGGGRFVHQREEQIIRRLINYCELPEGAIALDAPTGTGRFIPLLKEIHLKVIATDISKSMIDVARKFNAEKYVQCSSESLPLQDASIHLILMSRFCFHFQDQLPFFREAVRVLMPKGYLIVDMYHYTPRSCFPPLQKLRGGQTFTHSAESIYNIAEATGLKISRRFSVFYFPPYFYSLMPFILVKWIERKADKFDPRHKSKSYYLLRKKETIC